MTEVDHAHEMARMEQQRREHNEEVRSRQYCQVCSVSVRERDHPFKYAAAGGAITGPFCSDDCYWKFMVSGDE